MSHIRVRTKDVDRHNIPKPFMKLKNEEQGPLPDNILALRLFANALLKTRIPDLFKTSAGLAGHAQQIQQELSRLKDIEGLEGYVVDEIIHTEKVIRNALKRSIDSCNFTLPWQFNH